MSSEPKTYNSEFTFRGTATTVRRVGYGAMQLAGPSVWGPPDDPEEAVAVLREAIKLGVNHIDTSDFYGPHVTNNLIREALHPYPEELVIVTKVGFRRSPRGAWLVANSAKEIESAVHDNLRNLGLESLDVVNLRLPDGAETNDKDFYEPLEMLERLRGQGLVSRIGLSNVGSHHVDAAERVTPIVCVQNQYNMAHRHDDQFIDELQARGIAYVPFFPLGGFSRGQSAALASAAVKIGVTPVQLALAWMLQRAPNILLIPGTASLAHLRQNTAVESIKIPPDLLAQLDGIERRT